MCHHNGSISKKSWISEERQRSWRGIVISVEPCHSLSNTQFGNNNPGADLLSIYLFPCCNCIHVKRLRTWDGWCSWSNEAEMEDIPQGESPALRLQLLAPGFLSHQSRAAVGMFSAIKLLLPNSAGGHVTRTSMSLKITVVCMRWRTPERNLNCRQNRTPPFIHSEISTSWKDGFEKEVFGLFLMLISGIQDIEEIYWPPKMSALAFLLAPAMQRDINKRKTDICIKVWDII